MTTPPPTPKLTRFIRHPYLPGFNLETSWGPATIRPVRNGWFVFALVKGTAIGQRFRKLRPALIAAMQIRGVMSSALVGSIEDLGKLPTE